MKSKVDWIKVGAITIVIIQTIALVIVLFVETRVTPYSDEMPEDFNFTASLWTDSYTIDTYENRYTKALDWEVDTVIPLTLTREEKELIYKTIIDIDIYRYPDNYAPVSTNFISPSFTFFIKMTIDGYDLSINWEENTHSETKSAKRLRKLFEEIKELLEKHNEVKDLPESNRIFI